MNGCQKFISQKAPIVHTIVRVTVRPTQAGECQGIRSERESGAFIQAKARKTTAWTENMVNVVEAARFAANSFFSIHRIWPMKKKELSSVSHSPRPSRSVRQSKRPRIATPAS